MKPKYHFPIAICPERPPLQPLGWVINNYLHQIRNHGTVEHFLIQETGCDVHCVQEDYEWTT
jgi:hypothetical protein